MEFFIPNESSNRNEKKLMTFGFREARKDETEGAEMKKTKTSVASPFLGVFGKNSQVERNLHGHGSDRH